MRDLFALGEKVLNDIHTELLPDILELVKVLGVLLLVLDLGLDTCARSKLMVVAGGCNQRFQAVFEGYEGAGTDFPSALNGGLSTQPALHTRFRNHPTRLHET